MKKLIFLFLVQFIFGCKEVEVPEEVALAMNSINEEVDYNIHVKKYFRISVLVAMGMMQKAKSRFKT